jgi:3'5'-cyclic nucleotide phosphodiesterase
LRQGDKERECGMSVSPLCDRDRVSVPKSQLTFLDYVVKPSYEALHDLAPNTAAMALAGIEAARQRWASQMPQPS